jgi:hypothetical protein
MLVMRTVTLTDIDGNLIPGAIAECEACGGNEFIITQVNHQSHPHYQCLGCGESYCGTWDGTQCNGNEVTTQ